jgi:hypothetical protein
MKQYLEEREKDLLNNFAREHFHGLEYDKLPDDVKDKVVAKVKKYMFNSIIDSSQDYLNPWDY